MRSNSAAKQLVDKNGAYCLGWAIAQQLIVAASTFFLIESMRQLTAQADFPLFSVVGFVASLIVVHLPYSLSQMYLQKWNLSSFSKFVHQFASTHFAKSTGAHSRTKILHESWLTNIGLSTFENGINTIFQIVSTFLSTLFNILVIAWLIDWNIFFFYLIAAGLLCISGFFFSQKISLAATASQRSRNQLSTVMLSAWDNIFLGNIQYFKNWMASFRSSLEENTKMAVKYDLARSVISSVSLIGVLGIVSTGNALYFYSHQNSVPDISSLLISLPRQLQTIQNVFLFFNLMLTWQGVSSQLNELSVKTRAITAGLQPESFINLKDISVVINGREKSYTSVEELLTEVLILGACRVTLIGKNGSGKSTLLSVLAERAGKRSFYLPTNSQDLFFNNPEIAQMSDGLRVLSIFNEISDSAEADFLLLDEWDANLDIHNIKLLNEKINELASTKTIIESRHRA